MTAGNVSDCITQAYKNQAKTQTNSKASDRRAGKYRASAGKKYQKHRSDSFSK